VLNLIKGGYGTARTLAQLESILLAPSVLTNSPKWLVGYSDVTALHALWNKAGLVSMHGPMGSDIQSFTEANRQAMFSVLSGTQAVTQSFSGAIRYTAPGGGGATGRLLGGNLSVLASLVGSGFLPSYQGAILLVEDTGEAACMCLFCSLL
jgi:muramoyltetrapeptide carboxypeptidase